jgi:hypothetical protein
MQLVIEQASTPSTALPPLARLLALLCIVLFTLQLVASAAHRHEGGKAKPHCAACQAAAVVPGPVSATPPPLLVVFLAVAYVLARLPAGAQVRAPAYLSPPGQGPPAPVSPQR